MPRQRFDTIDTLRGAAIVWMTAYHFCFDLNWFGWLREDFYRDPFWTWQRTAIVSLFLFCAGLGQAVAWQQRQGWPRFWKRWAQVAGCALLVTAGSWFDVPAQLHLLRRAARHRGDADRRPPHRRLGTLAVAGAARWRSWPSRWPKWRTRNGRRWTSSTTAPGTGSASSGRKPVTEDYVPLVPWLGVMWWGMAAGQWLLAHRRAWVQRRLPRTTAPLAWLGRWSLTWYMLHQPVLIGALALVRQATI